MDIFNVPMAKQSHTAIVLDKIHEIERLYGLAVRDKLLMVFGRILRKLVPDEGIFLGLEYDSVHFVIPLNKRTLYMQRKLLNRIRREYKRTGIRINNQGKEGVLYLNYLSDFTSGTGRDLKEAAEVRTNGSEVYGPGKDYFPCLMLEKLPKYERIFFKITGIFYKARAGWFQRIINIKDPEQLIGHKIRLVHNFGLMNFVYSPWILWLDENYSFEMLLRKPDDEAKKDCHMIYKAFHRLWTKAAGNPDYVKDEWNELWSYLSELRVL